MADPTISDLEKAHKTQLGNLITSWDFFYVLNRKYYDQGKTYATSKEIRDLNKLAMDVYLKLTLAWILRQIKYETKAFAPSSGLVYPGVIKDFMKRKTYQEWRNKAVKYIANK